MIRRRKEASVKKLSPKTAYIIIGAVFLLMVAALVAQVAMEGKMTSQIAVRTLIPMGVCVSAFARIYTGNRGSRGRVFYEKLYEEELADAFTAPDQKSARRRLVKGVRDFHEDRLEKALTTLEALCPSCTKPADYGATYFFIGRVYSGMGLLDKAVQAYETTLSHTPANPSAWNNIGSIHMKRGDFDAAADCFRRAADIDRHYVMAYNNMAQLQLRFGHWQDSIRFAAHAVRLQSDLAPALNALALSYYALGHRTEGRKYADLAARHGSNRQSLENLFRRLDSGENPFTPGMELPIVVEEALEHFRRRHARPMLRIALPAEGSNVGRSRVGGESVGEPPVDSHGKPMRLLAAVWCSETQGMADLPERGILRFFIAEDRDCGCNRLSPTEQTDFRILYTPDEDAFGACEYETKFDMDTDFPVKGCFPICFVPGMGTPLVSDYRFRDALEEALEKAGAPSVEDMEPTMYRAICRQNQWGGHRMGGYPCFEDIDPRYQTAYQDYDALLLQIVSHEMVFDRDGSEMSVNIIEFGHNGGCQFLISRNKLRAKDFSDVLYWWDESFEDTDV